jgi:serine protease Do
LYWLPLSASRLQKMYKHRIRFIIPFLAFIAFASSAHSQIVPNSQLSAKEDLPGYLSAAIAKGYQAAVLMWQIDPETGHRMSAQFSGVVVSRDGVILSAAHVVMSGNTYKVMYANGKECVARGLGRITLPPDHMVPDAAMLKIVTKGTWPFAEMGWSSSLTVGQACISIAYPESLEQRKPNVRFGKISMLRNEYGFLQSTCIMEPGDSGGPLFDLLGRVIGIHSGILSPEDINYEVPVDTYRKYWSALSQTKDYQSLPVDSNRVAQDSLKSLLSTMPEVGTLKNQLAKIEDKFSATCLKIKSNLDGKEQQINGTLISLKGLRSTKNDRPENVIVSKSSMLGDNPVAVDARGRIIKLSVVARSRPDDLVLLLAAKDLGKGIVLTPTATDSISISQLGTFLLSPMVDSAVRIGVLGSLNINLPNVTSHGYLGAATELKSDKLIFKSVLPNSAAELSGIKPGDIISTVDGLAVEDELDFVKAIGKHQAGDTVSLAIITSDKNYTKKVVLKYPPQRLVNHPAELFIGGKSIRRDNFDCVFTQDAKVRATECGGPVFDINNNFVGINIARFSRTTTIIMPVKQIRQCLKLIK